MAITTTDQNDDNKPLDQSGVKLGINVSVTGKELEVAGATAFRSSAEGGGTAVGITGDGIVWWNGSYEPGNHTSGWKSTLMLANGNLEALTG